MSNKLYLADFDNRMGLLFYRDKVKHYMDSHTRQKHLGSALYCIMSEGYFFPIYYEICGKETDLIVRNYSLDTKETPAIYTIKDIVMRRVSNQDNVMTDSEDGIGMYIHRNRYANYWKSYLFNQRGSLSHTNFNVSSLGLIDSNCYINKVHIKGLQRIPAAKLGEL